MALGNFKTAKPYILKATWMVSVEALSEFIAEHYQPKKLAVSVVHKAVGAITESDVAAGCRNRGCYYCSFMYALLYRPSKLAKKKVLK